MMIVNSQKTLKILRLLRPSLHCKKVDDLNKQKRLTTARFAHSVNKLAQPRNETIITDPKQWSTRNIAHARRFDHEHSRTSFSKSSIPIKILLRDKAVLGCTPRHHRRYPRPAARLEIADSNRTEQSRTRGFPGGGPARLEYLMTNWIREFPHVPLHRLPDYRDYA